MVRNMGRKGRKEITISELKEHQDRFQAAADRIRKSLTMLKLAGISDTGYSVRVESMIDMMVKSSKDAEKSTLKAEHAVSDHVKTMAEKKADAE